MRIFTSGKWEHKRFPIGKGFMEMLALFYKNSYALGSDLIACSKS